MGSKLDAMRKAAGKVKAPPVKAPDPPKPPDDGKPAMKPRLPDGSAFAVMYDAAAVQWSGSLVVPGVGTWAHKARGVMGLLAKLDTMYRKAAKVKAEATDGQGSV